MGIFNKPDKKMLLDWRGSLVGIGSVFLVTLVKNLAQPDIVSVDNTLLYVLAIIVIAIFYGLGPSILVSLLSVALYDYFFVSPAFTFVVGRATTIPILIGFLVIGIIISFLASSLRNQTSSAKKANEELQLRSDLLEQATDAILLLDFNNVILYANGAAYDMYGYGKGELIGMRLHSLIAPQEESLFAERNKIIAEQGEFRSEAIHLRKDKSKIPIDEHSHLIKIGPTENIISVLRDITEQKNIRAEREAFSNKLLEAQEEERKRIALELHDDASPNLAYLGLELDAVNVKYPGLPEEVTQRLQRVIEKVLSVQQDIRRYSHELHPAILDNLGLEAAFICCHRKFASNFLGMPRPIVIDSVGQ